MNFKKIRGCNVNRGGKGKRVEKIINMIIEEYPNNKNALEDIQEIIDFCVKNQIDINLKLINKR